MVYKCGLSYKRKILYWLITFPLIIMYFIIGYYLYQLNGIFLLIYSLFFVITILFQSYNCVHWKCPHVGTACPGVGGFCVLSSPVARGLIKLNIKTNEKTYKILCSVAFFGFLGIIIFPIYFIAKINLFLVGGYLLIIGLYYLGMTFMICPHCGARKNCPGGKSSTKLIERLKNDKKIN
ncbi:MAG: hypothetical protein P8X70_00060 [Nanoarchaeota archaeon]